MRSYFQLVNSFYGEVYFRVSKHLGVPVSEVIRLKFTHDIKFLIMRYSHEIRAEVKQAEEIREKTKEFESQ